MTARQHEHAWLDSQALRSASDIALGCVLAIAGGVAIASVQGQPFVQLERMGPWTFPAALGYALAAVGAILIVRGILLRPGRPVRWNAAAVLALVPGITAAFLVAREWSTYFMLMLGPSEFTALFALELAVGIAVVRGSLLRAIGMALLGLLLATVGTDIEFGQARFTLGLIQLQDGMETSIIALGMIVVADGLVMLASPALLAAIYVRQVAGLASPPMPMSVGLGLRALAVIAIAVSVYFAHGLNNAMWDVYLLLAFAALGLVCKMFDWNRYVLILAFALSPVIEENIRRALLIARGSLATFVRWPLSAGMLLAAGSLLAAAGLLSIRHALLQRRAPA